MHPSSTKELRRHLIQQRLSQSPKQCANSSHIIFKKIITHPLFIRSNRIAIYLPMRGEVDIQLVQTKAEQMQKSCFLPVLHPFKHNRLLFIGYKCGDKLVKNRYGIWEPVIDTDKIVAPWSLDLVITPLVAFDTGLNRLGMGGGFYDRTFAFTRHKKFLHSPILMGVAYEFQKVPPLETHPWDIALNTVVTEQSIY